MSVFSPLELLLLPFKKIVFGRRKRRSCLERRRNSKFGCSSRCRLLNGRNLGCDTYCCGVWSSSFAFGGGLEVAMPTITCMDLACLRAFTEITSPCFFCIHPLFVHYLHAALFVCFLKRVHACCCCAFCVTKATNWICGELRRSDSAEAACWTMQQQCMNHLVLLLLSKEGDYGFCHQERSIAVL